MNKFYTLLLSLFLPFISTAQTVSFTYQADNGNTCNPALINFTSTTSQTPIGYTWTFGNGQQSNSTNPSTIYLNAGTYTVKLVVVFSNQAVETSQTITINQNVTSLISSNRNFLCDTGAVIFTASSSGNIGSYLWNFGDGTTATTTTPTISHSYTSFGSYNANVKVTDVSGCFSTSSDEIINVQKPIINGTVTPETGCAPINAIFTSNVNLPSGDFVSSYLWDFDDASPNSAIGSHTYSTGGSFTPTISIVSNDGCTNTYTYPTLNYGSPPVITSAYPKSPTYCGSDAAEFVALSPTATAFTFNYGDGITDSIADTLASHKYATLGVKTVTVTPYFNGCAGPPVTFTVTIVGVIANFNYSNTCTDRKTFSFTNTSQGIATSIIWNFDDGSPNANTPNAIHTFPSPGVFITSLRIEDSLTGCTDQISRIIKTANPTLVNSDTFLCVKQYSTFTVQNDYSPGALYTWQVLGLPPIITSTGLLDTTTNVFGNYTNNYVVINNGASFCPDTVMLNHPISVRGPILNFPAPNIVCSITNFLVLNSSAPYLSTDTITNWEWNFGTQGILQTIYQPLPIQTPVQVSDFVDYPIQLVATDKNGCTDSLRKVITAKLTPFLRIFPRDVTLCRGDSAKFIAFYSDALLWLSPPNPSCATCDTTIIKPLNTGYIYATAQNSLGCVARDSSFAVVYVPFTASALSTPPAVCLNDTVRLSSFPAGKKIMWSPVTNISNTSIYNPIVSANTTTTYTAVLEDSAGCFRDTASVDVVIKSLPRVNAGSDQILPYFTQFKIAPVYSNNIVSYTWSPAGSLDCTNCPSPTAAVDADRIYTIKVVSDSGCVASDDIKISINCKNANIYLPSAFTPNKDGKNDIFRPSTRGIKSISTFVVYNRYGQKVYEAKNFKPNDASIGWDGKINRVEQNPDAFVFFIIAVCNSGEIIEKKDSFVLLK
jgi:gliding motility-associated-like protein